MFSFAILLICGVIMPFILLIFGMYFARKLGFFYILHPIKTAKKILRSKEGMRALSVALGGTLGIGNIVGVASAVISGGAGAVFWMIASSFVAMSLKYCEVFLSMKYKVKRGGKYAGGAPYYISKGCEKKFGAKVSFIFGGVFALFCILNSLSTGNLVQINAISSLFTNKMLFGFVFAFFVFLAIIRGADKISSITSFLMPLLTLCYVGVSLYIIICFRCNIGYVLSEIFKGAFCLKSVGSGICGYGISRSIRYGVCRGVLSNEAGVGSATMAHASSSLDAESQACLGIFEVFIDTVVLCLLSSFVILMFPSFSSEPLSLVIFSYQKGIGVFGKYFIIVTCILFAYATVICQYYYGEKALEYFNISKPLKKLFLMIFLTVCILSPIVKNEIMWQISDIILSVMTIFNILFVFTLRKEINYI